MGKLGKQHKTTPTTWACPVFQLANFTLALVGMNIEKREMKFVTPEFSPPFFGNNTVETA